MYNSLCWYHYPISVILSLFFRQREATPLSFCKEAEEMIQEYYAHIHLDNAKMITPRPKWVFEGGFLFMNKTIAFLTQWSHRFLSWTMLSSQNWTIIQSQIFNSPSQPSLKFLSIRRSTRTWKHKTKHPPNPETTSTPKQHNKTQHNTNQQPKQHQNHTRTTQTQPPTQPTKPQKCAAKSTGTGGAAASHTTFTPACTSGQLAATPPQLPELPRRARNGDWCRMR